MREFDRRFRLVGQRSLPYLSYGIATGRFRRKLFPISVYDLFSTIGETLRFQLKHDDLTHYNAVQKILVPCVDGSELRGFLFISGRRSSAGSRKAGIIFCSCSGPRLPDELIRTADEVYVRLHGPKRWYRYDYSDDELLEWANKIKASAAKCAWIYFNNDNDAHAPKNAMVLRRLLAGFGRGTTKRKRGPTA